VTSLEPPDAAPNREKLQNVSKNDYGFTTLIFYVNENHASVSFLFFNRVQLMHRRVDTGIVHLPIRESRISSIHAVFSPFLCEKLPLSLERLVVLGLCKIAALYAMNPAGQPRAAVSTAGANSGSHPDTYAGKLLSLQFPCE